MMPIECNVVDCSEARVVAGLPWNGSADGAWWGAFVCRLDDTAGSLAGAWGPVSGDAVYASCAGALLSNVGDSLAGLFRVAVACGLSVLGATGVELGDMVVVAGQDPLALMVLLAARAQGIRAICLAAHPDMAGVLGEQIRLAAEQVLVYEQVNAFEADLEAALASATGGIAFVDTGGQPALVYEMAARLRKYSALVLCRQDSADSVMLALRELHHLKSARFVYWSHPASLRSGLEFEILFQRAARLIRWNRIAPVDLAALGASVLEH